eukprot:g639.t1
MFSGVPRIVVHIDLDCFYCQVEQRRLGIDRDIPCAVQQWHGLIAVNYAAKAFGVNRFMRVSEAKEKCPSLQLLHVETIGKEGKTEILTESPWVAKQLKKASLDRYRQASEEILNLMKTLVPPSQIEKASIDEVFIDLSSLIKSELKNLDKQSGTRQNEVLEQSVVVGGPVDLTSTEHLALVAGASITLKIRMEVYDKLGFTCSAGIANNKQTAKLTSAMNKPSKQTIVTEAGVCELMRELPLKKIPKLGGKLGSLLEKELDCKTAGDVQQVEFYTLSNLFGMEKANWVANAVRGVNTDEVKPKKLFKSMTSAKHFDATKDLEKLKGWIEILSIDLADRVSKEMVIHNRIPKTLSLGWVCERHNRKSKVCPLPRFGDDDLEVQELSNAGIVTLQSSHITQPCSYLELTFSNFIERPKKGLGSIVSYLSLSTIHVRDSID